MALKKPVMQATPVGPAKGPEGGSLADYPTVWAFLSALTWPEDGSPRVPGSITLFTEDGVWKAAVNDKTGYVAFVSGRSPEGLLEAIEEGMEAGSLDWRKSKPRLGQGGRKGP
jgi:hypothetical protein